MGCQQRKSFLWLLVYGSGCFGGELSREQPIHIKIIGLEQLVRSEPLAVWALQIPIYVDNKQVGVTNESGELHVKVKVTHRQLLSVHADPPPPLKASEIASETIFLNSASDSVKPMEFEIYIYIPKVKYRYILRPRALIEGRLVVNNQKNGEWVGEVPYDGSFLAREGSQVLLQVIEHEYGLRASCLHHLGDPKEILVWDLQDPSEICPLRRSDDPSKYQTHLCWAFGEMCSTQENISVRNSDKPYIRDERSNNGSHALQSRSQDRAISRSSLRQKRYRRRKALGADPYRLKLRAMNKNESLSSPLTDARGSRVQHVSVVVRCSPKKSNIFVDEEMLLPDCREKARLYVVPGERRFLSTTASEEPACARTIFIPPEGLKVPIDMRGPCVSCFVKAKSQIRRSALKTSDYDCLRRIPRTSNRWLLAQQILGRSFFLEKEFKKAAQTLEMASATPKGRTSGEIYAQLAEVHYLDKNYGKALAAYQQAWRYRTTLKGSRQRRVNLILNLLRVNAGVSEQFYITSATSNKPDPIKHRDALDAYRKLMSFSMEANNQQGRKEARDGLKRLNEDIP